MSKPAKFNGNRAEVKAHRQLAVARHLTKGRSQREIRRLLEGEGNVNPEKGAAWSLGIIARDCKDLEQQWKESAAADIAEAKGRQLAETREARRVAWELKDINQVRLLIKLEMELLGTEAAKSVEVGGKGGGPITHEHKGQTHGSVDHLAAVVATLAGVGAFQLPGDAGGDSAENDGLHPA